MVVTALTMAFAFVCGCSPVLEQPSGSFMPKAQPLKSVLQAIYASKTLVYHGAYSHTTQKPLQLWSPADLQSLWRPRPPKMLSDLVTVRVKTNRDGSVRLDARGRPMRSWTGNKPKMRASQTYCPNFGKAVAKLAKYFLVSATRWDEPNSVFFSIQWLHNAILVFNASGIQWWFQSCHCVSTL